MIQIEITKILMLKFMLNKETSPKIMAVEIIVKAEITRWIQMPHMIHINNKTFITNSNHIKILHKTRVNKTSEIQEMGLMIQEFYLQFMEGHLMRLITLEITMLEK